VFGILASTLLLQRTVATGLQKEDFRIFSDGPVPLQSNILEVEIQTAARVAKLVFESG
jgi:hypothetical protein